MRMMCLTIFSRSGKVNHRCRISAEACILVLSSCLRLEFLLKVIMTESGGRKGGGRRMGGILACSGDSLKEDTRVFLIRCGLVVVCAGVV